MITGGCIALVIGIGVDAYYSIKHGEDRGRMLDIRQLKDSPSVGGVFKLVFNLGFDFLNGMMIG